ncbi:hypothetical protein [Novosphingobium album (ex Liu et al. 2023)]|nr:hypothetical protein [Novosphingobium album (ex Liu et al. 2023)]
MTTMSFICMMLLPFSSQMACVPNPGSIAFPACVEPGRVPLIGVKPFT